jgi:hypothetical protein
MKKNIITVVLFVLPLLVLFGLIVYRKSHPLKPSDNQLATATNPNYRKQQENWLTNQFDALFGAEDIPDKIKDLPIRFTDSVQKEVDGAELHGALNRVVQSLFAKTFDEYLSQRSVGESLLLDQNSIAGQGQVLQRFHKVQQLPANLMELHKMYWSKTTEDGKRATLWNAASWKASWVECHKTTKLDVFTSTKAFSESLMPSVPNCGIVGYASSFEYGPTPKEILSKDGHIVIALAYVLVKTSEGKAYPLMVQFYWASSIRTWLPTHLAVGYVGNRQFDPVF